MSSFLYLSYTATLSNTMAFNHYAKLKRIIDEQPEGWFIMRIDQPTTSKSFSGEVRTFDHYYRLYSPDGTQIKYGKFQQIDKLASILNIPTESLPVVAEELS